MNVAYFPAGRKVWFELARKMDDLSLHPVIWFGDPRLDKLAKNEFSECEVLNFFELNKGNLPSCRITNYPTNRQLRSPSFLKLKDQVYKMMDRQDDFFSYGRLDREANFYRIFNYFFSIIKEKKIELAFYSESPHSPAALIFYGVCEILGIKQLHCISSSIIPVIRLSSSLNSKGMLSNVGVENKKTDFLLELINYIDSFKDTEPYYMLKQKDQDDKFNSKKKLKIIILILKGIKKNIKWKGKDYNFHRNSYSKEKRPRFIIDVIKLKMKEALKHRYLSSVKAVDLNKKFVFYPLHYEPERTSNPDGGEYYNSYDSILALREFVPKNVPIYIKEHYSQFTLNLNGHQGRSLFFYDAIKEIENVYFVDMDIESKILIEKSILTVSQTGTACLEAACAEKLSLILGAPWFTGCPNVYDFDNLIDNNVSFEDFIKKNKKNIYEIKCFFSKWLRSDTVPGCINPSNEVYFREKKPGQWDFLDIDKSMLDGILSVLERDLIKGENSDDKSIIHG